MSIKDVSSSESVKVNNAQPVSPDKNLELTNDKVNHVVVINLLSHTKTEKDRNGAQVITLPTGTVITTKQGDVIRSSLQISLVPNEESTPPKKQNLSEKFSAWFNEQIAKTASLNGIEEEGEPVKVFKSPLTETEVKIYQGNFVDYRVHVNLDAIE